MYGVQEVPRKTGFVFMYLSGQIYLDTGLGRGGQSTVSGSINLTDTNADRINGVSTLSEMYEQVPDR